MTNEEKQKAINALKISAPVKAVTQEEFNDYIQTLNRVMDWLEQEPFMNKPCVAHHFDQEPKIGEWIGGSICSRCNYKKMPLWQYKYCPNCGSKNSDNEEDKKYDKI